MYGKPRTGESVNVHEAKTHLSKLLAKVENGEEIIIARSGRPIARLVPIVTRRPSDAFGAYKDALPDLPEELFAPDPEIERMFYGD